MKPIIPFEPISSDLTPAGSNWIGQVKWDGVRVLTYYDGEEVELYNRHLKKRTHHYPELREIAKYCSAASVILDGEIIALNEGKPSFYRVMKRDGITNLANVAGLCNSVPIIYMIFDILFHNGSWLTSRTLGDRQKVLKKIITPNNNIQLVENFPDSQALFNVVKAQELEGIVIKDLNSTYLINGKDGRWLKQKYFRDLIAVVGGVTCRGSLINSLLLGLYNDEGKLRYIGHAGGGKLSQEDWRTLTEGIKPLVEAKMPFEQRPPRSKEALWLKPHLTVKVSFAEWLEGNILRQPTIQAFVTVKPEECLLPRDIL